MEKPHSLKYIVTDIDGTLLKHENDPIPDEFFALVDLFIEQGITFIVASGRQLENEKNLFAPVEDKVYYIAENGTLAVHEDDILVSETLEPSLTGPLIKEIQKNPDAHIFVSTPDHTYVLNHDKDLQKIMVEILHYNFETVDRFDEIQKPVLKITAKIPSYKKEDFDAFSEKYPDLKISLSGNDWIHFVSPESSKGHALERLLKKLEIDPKEGIAFGDQENDIEMLRLAGTGYAVEGASEVAIEAADHCCVNELEVLKSWI